MYIVCCILFGIIDTLQTRFTLRACRSPVCKDFRVGIRTRPELNFVPVPDPPVLSGIRTGSCTRLCHQNRNWYQALLPEPVPGSVTGTGTGTRLCYRNRFLYQCTRLCHRNRNWYQALLPELVPGSVTGTGSCTRLCHQS